MKYKVCATREVARIEQVVKGLENAIDLRDNLIEQGFDRVKITQLKKDVETNLN